MVVKGQIEECDKVLKMHHSFQQKLEFNINCEKKKGGEWEGGGKGRRGLGSGEREERRDHNIDVVEGIQKHFHCSI